MHYTYLRDGNGYDYKYEYLYIHTHTHTHTHRKGTQRKGEPKEHTTNNVESDL